ncbi:MAG TPA: acyl-CoA reductase [Longimicrobiaceae bacterium]|nr:acyl-CoA reductase [Longimicrobiaceae bacterium]
MIAAFHLPALSHLPTTTWGYGRGKSGIVLRLPQLTPALLRLQLNSLKEAHGRYLAERPVAEIIAVVDQVAARLLDVDDPLRRIAVAALPLVTGYSAPMIERVLDRMAADWRADRLRRLLEAEFGDMRVLDCFTARAGAGGSTRAFGPRLALHVFSGNVPGVSVTSLIRSLLVKAATLGKTAVGEPLLPALFAQAVAEADAELGACLAVAYWPGGDEAIESMALAAADAVVVYGGADSVASLRARTPAHSRFLGYGHKLSFGIIARESLARREAGQVAAAAALEAATFDQQGCVSPHLFYVEKGAEVSAPEWARLLAAAMARLERELPRGTLAPGEASAIRQLRGEAEFAQIAGSGVEVHASAEGTTWTVIYDPDPAFTASCLNRVVRVKPVDELEKIPSLIEPIASLLQTVGVAAHTERLRTLAETLGRLGASRVTALGQMAWPPPSWHHDGRPPLRDLVRWCDLEESVGCGA